MLVKLYVSFAGGKGHRIKLPETTNKKALYIIVVDSKKFFCISIKNMNL